MVIEQSKILSVFFFTAKPMPRQEDFVTGYQKIIQDAKKVGADPFEVEDRDAPTKIAGSGTKSDPYIVPSRNTRRLVLVERKLYSSVHILPISSISLTVKICIYF